ncbi:iron transporter [Deinococcus psychrotolerans]|uniref:Iron transporter n=1 Tax=Deinococcus psychrotolerans TaxID=2489213 RepID=A0A3G8YM36_9DEIO|nr:ferrous iron transport protein A [Deinococcus psychrotolerans]AZI42206.1 iron transporter [Deinococcus psychrotolerans]
MTVSPSDVTLSTLKPGEAAYVVALDPKHPLRRRLLELGFIRGAKVDVMRLAPMGDPVHLRLGNTDLALRAADLVGVTVRRS